MSKKRIIALVAASFFCWLLFVIAKMPAGFVLEQVAKKTNAITFSGSQGTIWDGSVQSLTVNANRKIINLGQVQWQLAPIQLFFGQAAIEITAKNQQQLISGQFSVSAFRRLTAEDAEIMVPVSLLTSLYPVPAKVNGFIELSLTSLDVSLADQWIDELDGQLLIKDLDVKIQKSAELGTYGIRLQLDESGERVLAKITDVDAVIEVSGEVSLNQEKRTYAADLLIKPKPNTDQVILGSLQFIAKKQGDGSFKLNQSGTLPK